MLKINKKIKNDKKNPFSWRLHPLQEAMGEVWLWDHFLILVTLLELSMRPPYGLWGIKTLGDDFMIDNIWKEVQDAPKKKSMLWRRRRAEKVEMG